NSRACVQSKRYRTVKRIVRSDESSVSDPKSRNGTASRGTGEFTARAAPLRMTRSPATPLITRPVRNDSGPKAHRRQSRSKAAETGNRLEEGATEAPEQQQGSPRHARWGMYCLEC